MLTDSTEAVKNTYAYDPWGNSLGKTEAVSNPWQFAGGFYDATTGLYKFGTRYYSPSLGRWTQQDPVGGSVGKVGSGDAYVYADNAPVMTTDPSGRATCFNQLGGASTILLFSAIAIVALVAAPVALLTTVALIGAVGVFAGTYWQATDVLNSCQATGQP